MTFLFLMLVSIAQAANPFGTCLGVILEMSPGPTEPGPRDVRIELRPGMSVQNIEANVLSFFSESGDIRFLDLDAGLDPVREAMPLNYRTAWWNTNRDKIIDALLEALPNNFIEMNRTISLPGGVVNFEARQANQEVVIETSFQFPAQLGSRVRLTELGFVDGLLFGVYDPTGRLVRVRYLPELTNTLIIPLEPGNHIRFIGALGPRMFGPSWLQ